MEKFTAIDERHFKNFITVLIMKNDNCEMRHVKLTPENQTKYNRNLSADLELLWNLYNSNPDEFKLKY